MKGPHASPIPHSLSCQVEGDELWPTDHNTSTVVLEPDSDTSFELCQAAVFARRSDLANIGPVFERRSPENFVVTFLTSSEPYRIVFAHNRSMSFAIMHPVVFGMNVQLETPAEMQPMLALFGLDRATTHPQKYEGGPADLQIIL